MTYSLVFLNIVLYALLWHAIGFMILILWAFHSRFLQTLDRYLEAQGKPAGLASGIMECICIPVVAAAGVSYHLYQKTLTWLEDRTEDLREEKRRRK